MRAEGLQDFYEFESSQASAFLPSRVDNLANKSRDDERILRFTH